MSFARVRALVVVGVLTIFALTIVVVALVRDTQSGVSSAADCPEGFKLADVRLREPKDVKINVFNATETRGLAETVGDDFRNRKFQVVKEGNEPKNKGVSDVAVLRYGPKAAGSYHLLRAYFLNEAVPEYQPERKDDLVDVVIGEGFKQLATITEVNQALAAAGEPDLPEQTCPMSNDT